MPEERSGTIDAPFDSIEHLRWAEAEFKQIDLYAKLSFEHRKLATEFSKILLSSLVAINSGGLVSLPAIALFLGLNDAKSRYHIFLFPALCYVCALMFALGSVLATYFNFDFLSQSEAVNSSMRIADIRRFRAQILNLKDIHTKITTDIARMQNDKIGLDKKIYITYIVGHIFGWASLFGFIGGGLIMLARSRG